MMKCYAEKLATNGVYNTIGTDVVLYYNTNTNVITALCSDDLEELDDYEVDAFIELPYIENISYLCYLYFLGLLKVNGYNRVIKSDFDCFVMDPFLIPKELFDIFNFALTHAVMKVYDDWAFENHLDIEWSTIPIDFFTI